MKNIVVAIDFSNNTQLLVDQALSLAKSFSSNLYLVHVESPNKDASGREASEGVEEIQKEYQEEAERLNSLAQTIREHDIEAHAIFIEGVIVSSILEEARKVNADLIITGSQGRSVAERLRAVSVTQSIIKQSSCPVLLVPSK